MTKITVRPDKNQFLLFSMLNALGMVDRKPPAGTLWEKTVEHFKDYQGLGLKKESFEYNVNPYCYVLTLNPDLSEKQGLEMNSRIRENVNIGRVVLAQLKHFLQNTDFEEFYQKILPEYQEECKPLQEYLNKIKIEQAVEEAWETDDPFDTDIIYIPLTREGFGPAIDGTSYPLLGYRSGLSDIQLEKFGSFAAHEASHPYAQRIIEVIKDKIDKTKHLFDLVKEHPKYPIKYYNSWQTCFEEHLVRVMDNGFISPPFRPYTNAQKELDREKNENGFIYIHDFYEEIKVHKQNPGNETMQDVAVKILERLDEKY